MFWKFICSDWQCPVMVFKPEQGSKCPGCGEDGTRTTEDQGKAVSEWYEFTKSFLWGLTQNKQGS